MIVDHNLRIQSTLKRRSHTRSIPLRHRNLQDDVDPLRFHDAIASRTPCVHNDTHTRSEAHKHTHIFRPFLALQMIDMSKLFFTASIRHPEDAGSMSTQHSEFKMLSSNTPSSFVFHFLSIHSSTALGSMMQHKFRTFSTSAMF